MAADGPARMYEAAETCAETSLGQPSLNRFECRTGDVYPDCGPNCDIYNEVQRGAITAAFNIGLKHHQAKELNVDTYNQGCLNPWGCVNDDGFSCGGRAKRFGAFMEQRFDGLNRPFEPTGLEYAPPFYMMGVKTGSANAVDGWARAPDGRFRWQAASPNQQRCA